MWWLLSSLLLVAAGEPDGVAVVLQSSLALSPCGVARAAATGAGEPLRAALGAVLARAAPRAVADAELMMSAALVGDVVVFEWAMDVLAHHDGAIAMAKIAVEHGEAADVQSLAREIIAAQEAEIIRMRILLARHEDALPAGVRP